MPTAATPDSLAGWPLAVRCAEALGWVILAGQREGKQPQGIPPGWRGDKLKAWRPLTAYHESLDACERHLIPEMQRRGWSYTLYDNYPNDGQHNCEFYYKDGQGPTASGATLAEAVCRAFLLAMREETCDAYY